MSRQDDDHELDAATRRALRDADDSIPTTEAEVGRAEASLDASLELPPGLRSYRARPSAAAAAPRRLGRSVGSHVAVAALGALAAGLALDFSKPAPAVPATSAGGELVPSAQAPRTPRVPLVFRSRCERECCAGNECRAASESLRACPSGARCIACGADYASGGPYKLRIGTVVPSATGQGLLPLEAPLELCISAPTSPAQCVPALVEAGGEQWRELKRVITVQDLLSGLSVELRQRGNEKPLASWKQAVSPSPDVMCKGLAVVLNDTPAEDQKAQTLARVSAFVEQAHFVELARAKTVPPLLGELARFDVSGLVPLIYETTSASPTDRFALVLGPVDRSEADALRWQALDHGVEAKVTHGLDFSGKPRPSH